MSDLIKRHRICTMACKDTIQTIKEDWVNVKGTGKMYLVACGFPARFGRHLDQNEGMQEVRLDARRREAGRVRLEENDAHNVVADVPLSLQLSHHHQ